MRHKLITAVAAADILGLAESTFRVKSREMGLMPVDLNAALPRGTKPLRDHWRWIEAEVMAFASRAVVCRDRAAAEQRRVLSFEKRAG
jgi:hypothetical protein